MRCGKCIRCRMVAMSPQLEGRRDLECEESHGYWVSAVTTVPERAEVLAGTLASLRASGFDPLIFADTEPKLGVHGRWYTAAAELYVRSPLAGYYAIFQDDVMPMVSLKCYLEQSEYPERGYWNLYEAQAERGKQGWYMSRQRGLGALGLAFSREALVTLLSTESFVKGEGQGLDGCIMDAMRVRGWREHCHSPSLLQHRRAPSTLGHPSGASAPRFSYGLGDAVEAALKAIGITEQRVALWLGGTCGCEERKEKLNALTEWALRGGRPPFVGPTE